MHLAEILRIRSVNLLNLLNFTRILMYMYVLMVCVCIGNMFTHQGYKVPVFVGKCLY